MCVSDGCCCRDGGLKRAKVKQSYKEEQQKMYSSTIVGQDDGQSGLSITSRNPEEPSEQVPAEECAEQEPEEEPSEAFKKPAEKPFIE